MQKKKKKKKGKEMEINKRKESRKRNEATTVREIGEVVGQNRSGRRGGGWKWEVEEEKDDAAANRCGQLVCASCKGWN